MKFTENEIIVLKKLVGLLNPIELNIIEFKDRTKCTYNICTKLKKEIEEYNYATGINKSDIINLAVQQFLNSKKDSK